jgi:hypothetical protein
MHPVLEGFGAAAKNALDTMTEKKKIWSHAFKLILNYSALVYELDPEVQKEFPEP